MTHNTETAHDTAAERDPSAPSDPARSLFARFVRDERGNVLLEYVLLLVGVFVAFEVTTAPLQAQLLDFAADVFEHLHLP